MKIILISPHPDIQAFGVRMLSACLKREKHDVKLIFLPRDFTKRYEEKTLNELVELSRNADLIGITLMTNFFGNSIQITQRLKKELNVPILWGGVHPTIRPAECLDYADMVCIGEGENTILEIAEKIKNKEGYQEVEGVWFKHKGEIIKNKIRPLIGDLNSLPFPDYEYKTHYILNDIGGICGMDEDLLKKHTDKIYITMATRGCPFGCTYCYNNRLNKMYSNQKIVRKRTMDNLIDELIRVKNMNIFKYIKLDDDAFFTCSQEEIKELCLKYKDKVGLPLMISGATPTTLTREKLLPLIDAGLIFIRFGIQSGSECTRKLYGRHYSNDQVEKAAKLINEFQHKLWTPKYDIILDNPWETEEDIIKTLMFLTRLPVPFHLSLYSLTFYPGTQLYEKAKREGIITDDLKDVYCKKYYCNKYGESKKTYLNRLFFLLHECGLKRIKISPETMSLLTNQRLRRLGLNWLIYFAFKIWITPVEISRFLKKGLEDLQKGDLSRINNYIKRRILKDNS